MNLTGDRAGRYPLDCRSTRPRQSFLLALPRAMSHKVRESAPLSRSYFSPGNKKPRVGKVFLSWQYGLITSALHAFDQVSLEGVTLCRLKLHGAMTEQYIRKGKKATLTRSIADQKQTRAYMRYRV